MQSSLLSASWRRAIHKLEAETCLEWLLTYVGSLFHDCEAALVQLEDVGDDFWAGVVDYELHVADFELCQLKVESKIAAFLDKQATLYLDVDHVGGECVQGNIVDFI